MNATKSRMNGYESVLDNLREQRKKIDRAILALEALQDGDIPALEVLEEGHDVGSYGQHSSYGGLQFIDAVKKVFAKSRGPLTTSEISDALLSGGFSSDSENPKKVIAAQLHRYAGNEESGIVKAARGLWALEIGGRRKTA